MVQALFTAQCPTRSTSLAHPHLCHSRSRRLDSKHTKMLRKRKEPKPVSWRGSLCISTTLGWGLTRKHVWQIWHSESQKDRAAIHKKIKAAADKAVKKAFKKAADRAPKPEAKRLALAESAGVRGWKRRRNIRDNVDKLYVV